MEQPIQVCPKCKEAVTFLDVGGKRQCPECSFEFEVAPPTIPTAGERRSALRTVVKFLLITLAVILGLLAVAFAGCLLLMRKM